MLETGFQGNKQYCIEIGFKDQPQDAPEVDDLWGFWQANAHINHLQVFEAWAFKGRFFGKWGLILCEQELDVRKLLASKNFHFSKLVAV